MEQAVSRDDRWPGANSIQAQRFAAVDAAGRPVRSEEHTSELQSPCNLVCRLLLEKKKNIRAVATGSRAQPAPYGARQWNRHGDLGGVPRLVTRCGRPALLGWLATAPHGIIAGDLR